MTVPLNSAQFPEPATSGWCREHPRERDTVPSPGELTGSIRISQRASGETLAGWYVNRCY